MQQFRTVYILGHLAETSPVSAFLATALSSIQSQSSFHFRFPPQNSPSCADNLSAKKLRNSNKKHPTKCEWILINYHNIPIMPHNSSQKALKENQKYISNHFSAQKICLLMDFPLFFLEILKWMRADLWNYKLNQIKRNKRTKLIKGE